MSTLFSFTDFDYKNKFAKLQRVKNQRAARTEMEAKGEIPKTVDSERNVGHTRKRLPRSESGTSERKEAKTKTFSQGMILDHWVFWRGNSSEILVVQVLENNEKGCSR